MSGRRREGPVFVWPNEAAIFPVSRPKALACQPNVSWRERRGGPVSVSERIMGAEAHWLMGRVMPSRAKEG